MTAGQGLPSRRIHQGHGQDHHLAVYKDDEHNAISCCSCGCGAKPRLGGDVAKPWIDLEGRMVISHALDGLCQHDAVISGVIVASPDMLEAAATLAHKIGWLAVAGGLSEATPSAPGLMHWRPYRPRLKLS